MQSKMGGVIELEVIRANGDVEYIGKVHNLIGSVAWQSVSSTGPGRIPYTSVGDANSGIPYFHTQSTKGSSLLDGTFSQSGTTVTRDSGTSSLLDLSLGDMIEFSTGEFAYKTSVGTATSCTVSKSQTVAATTAKRHKTNTVGYGRTPATGSVQTVTTTFYSMVGSYSNGVVTNTLEAPRVFPAATSAYTVRCISMMLKTGVSFTEYGAYFDLPVDINLAIGDILQVASFTFTVTYDAYTPRVFGASPLSGAVGTGRYQRLRPVYASEWSDFIRFYLVDDANKMTIPDMSVNNILASTAIPTRIEVIVPTTNSKITADYTNDCVESVSASGTVVTGGTVKQILWGDNNFLYGVIEYDTPISITPGQVITINTSMQMIVERPPF